MSRRHGTAERWGQCKKTGAALILQIEKYHILDQPNRLSMGEINLAAKGGRPLLMVGVASRKSYAEPPIAIGEHQQKRIKRSIEHFSP